MTFAGEFEEKEALLYPIEQGIKSPTANVKFNNILKTGPSTEMRGSLYDSSAKKRAFIQQLCIPRLQLNKLI